MLVLTVTLGLLNFLKSAENETVLLLGSIEEGDILKMSEEKFQSNLSQTWLWEGTRTDYPAK